ncbi:3-ketoacyl-CoA thiolase, peroxisomal isoform X2 [Cinclus cinclus]|uniref:3-ketoacyl-CoA thiolase, peroxisomal isoform X2 n=1 Tax=Cinclus cinclus TaxID=127875 RepID=UPI002E13532E
MQIRYSPPCMQMRGGVMQRAGRSGDKMAAARRAQLVLGHLAGAAPGPGATPRAVPCAGGPPRAGSPDDVVVVHGRRTAIGRARRGGFKDTTPDELLAAVMTAVLQDVSLHPEVLGDICVGNVLQPGAGALIARVAQFLSVETMSLRSANNPGDISSNMMDNPKARDCLIPMGVTSENVAEKFGVSRKKQDAFALASQQKAAKAQQMGLFKTEIVPVRTTVTDAEGNKKTITVHQDEGIRPSTTLEGLAKLKPAFKEDGSTTAGNASQVSDGAAAVLLAKRSKAAQLGLPVLGVLRSFAVVGVPPDVMGIGPAYAIPAAVEKAGLTLNDIDIYEINEAFASQAVYCVEKLGIPMEKVNPLGGAIALGHPLGCTGARQVVTLLNELKRRGKRAYGVVSMCIGTGMGAAAVFEYPGK